uniref:Uncharacterized protein n=1 Tax=Knipowitschia caucasica TaxID=637954 RepID=A0AAV2K6I8_KNICA
MVTDRSQASVGGFSSPCVGQCFLFVYDRSLTMSETRGNIVPPLLPYRCNQEEDLLQRNCLYPPILLLSCRTQGIPYKEILDQRHRSPSQIIGSNYNPRAHDFNLTKLPTRQTPSYSSSRVQGRTTRRSGPSATSKEAPRVRPLSPTEQREIMIRQENKHKSPEPTHTDLQRYEYYIQSIPCSVLPPEPAQQTQHIVSLSRSPLTVDKHRKNMQQLQKNLEDEVKQHYVYELKRSMVDYILMDQAERQRLSISSIPEHFPLRVIQAPVPWGQSYRETRQWHQKHLFTHSLITLLLQSAWATRFSSLRFVPVQELSSAGLPLPPSEFVELIQKQCKRTCEELLKQWLPHCAWVCRQCEELWLPHVLSEKQTSSGLTEELFGAVAALMSLQLRSLVSSSLHDLLSFFSTHQEGNDFGPVLQDLQYTQPQVLLVKLMLEGSHIRFEPSLDQCWLSIHQAFMEVIQSSKDIPRVESVLFPILELPHLLTVRPDESWVTDILQEAREIFDKNSVGPEKYLNSYHKYSDLLDERAKCDITAFLTEKHSLEGFAKKIQSIKVTWRKIVSMRVAVPLSMFCLDAGPLNEDLCERTERLQDLLVTFLVDENRELNNNAGLTPVRLPCVRLPVCVCPVCVCPVCVCPVYVCPVCVCPVCVCPVCVCPLCVCPMYVCPVYVCPVCVCPVCVCPLCVCPVCVCPVCVCPVYVCPVCVCPVCVCPVYVCPVCVCPVCVCPVCVCPVCVSPVCVCPGCVCPVCVCPVCVCPVCVCPLCVCPVCVCPVCVCPVYVCPVCVCPVCVCPVCICPVCVSPVCVCPVCVCPVCVCPVCVCPVCVCPVCVCPVCVCPVCRICQRYQDISDTMRGFPSSKQELEHLENFIKETSDVTVYKLLEEVDEAKSRLYFLMDHATLSPEDVRLNSSVFWWPTDIKAELDLSRTRLLDMRDQAEQADQAECQEEDHFL